MRFGREEMTLKGYILAIAPGPDYLTFMHMAQVNKMRVPVFGNSIQLVI
jgi:hypothetical protein